jgi:hypothetical protein
MFPKSVILIGNYHDILTSSVGSYDKHYNHIFKDGKSQKELWRLLRFICFVL